MGHDQPMRFQSVHSLNQLNLESYVGYKYISSCLSLYSYSMAVVANHYIASHTKSAEPTTSEFFPSLSDAIRHPDQPLLIENARIFNTCSSVSLFLDHYLARRASFLHLARFAHFQPILHSQKWQSSNIPSPRIYTHIQPSIPKRP